MSLPDFPDSVKITYRELVKSFLFAVLLLLAGMTVIPLAFPLFKGDYSAVILDEQGEILRVFLNTAEQWHMPPDEAVPVPAKLVSAVLCFEDKYFYLHGGVNPYALLRAAAQDISSRSTVSGASTLTMQLARLLKPKSRTIFNKLLEIFQALKIEALYSKEQILKLYLDHAPYGGNIIGYRTAALKYFGKWADHLTWGEAALLAILPNAPAVIAPGLDNSRLEEKRNRLLKKMLDLKIIDRETLNISLAEPVPVTIKDFPMSAPHLAAALQLQHQGMYVKTTINKQLQDDLTVLVAQQKEHLGYLGVKNVAVLVVETGSGKVRAYIGSQDFFDRETQGQVDGVMAPRSTGSILKPFLYALCMDEGMILPGSLLKDVETHFGSFSPVNSNFRYSGLVPAREALIRSLNVPAVRLLSEYGLYKFYMFLKRAGMSTLFRPYFDYGLPLIIGGAEATVFDMAALFRGLGNYGTFSPLKLLEGEGDAEKGLSLISPGAAWLVLDILKEVSRPEAEYYWQQYQEQWPLAWKTGTSYGQRDAWSIGVSPQWTIAVWAGNFSGEGNPNLKSGNSAAPLLFNVFNYLPKSREKAHWFARPDTVLTLVKVCKDTGYLATAECPATEYVPAPQFMRSFVPCRYHKTVYVTTDEKYSVCSLCWEPGKYKKVSRLLYPPDVVQYLRTRGQLINRIPPHKPDCPGLVNTKAVQILYPLENSKLWIPRDFYGTYEKITCKVAHRNTNQVVFWYLDSVYIKETTGDHNLALSLDKGWHELLVIDQDGQQDNVKFFVDKF